MRLTSLCHPDSPFFWRYVVHISSTGIVLTSLCHPHCTLSWRYVVYISSTWTVLTSLCHPHCTFSWRYVVHISSWSHSQATSNWNFKVPHHLNGPFCLLYAAKILQKIGKLGKCSNSNETKIKIFCKLRKARGTRQTIRNNLVFFKMKRFLTN